MPASGEILGRHSGPLSIAFPTRSILDVLEAERGVPLPARWSLAGEPDKAVLHVAVGRHSPTLLGRLEDRATHAALSLAGIVLHEDVADLPPSAPLRSDLREHTFELSARHQQPRMAGAVSA
jgi:hypothetical protein